MDLTVMLRVPAPVGHLRLQRTRVCQLRPQVEVVADKEQQHHPLYLLMRARLSVGNVADLTERWIVQNEGAKLLHLQFLQWHNVWYVAIATRRDILLRDVLSCTQS